MLSNNGNFDGQEARKHRAFGLLITNWYRYGHRPFPWREAIHPYRVIVSEVMLQQTRADTVIAYFERFMRAFPDVNALAAADLGGVNKLWQGLGYYSRARNLHKMANKVVHEYGGVFPHTYETLLTLPGVGAYTAGAVMSIAYHQPYPAVDGNVLRVVARFCGIDADIAEEKTKKQVREIVVGMIPPDEAADFCQGIMELGATLCTPVNPNCEACPIYENCTARLQGKQKILPVKKKKEKPIPSQQHVFVFRNQDDDILFVLRKEALLSGLWGLPHYETLMEKPVASNVAAMLKALVQEDRTAKIPQTLVQEDRTANPQALVQEDRTANPQALVQEESLLYEVPETLHVVETSSEQLFSGKNLPENLIFGETESKQFSSRKSEPEDLIGEKAIQDRFFSGNTVQVRLVSEEYLQQRMQLLGEYVHVFTHRKWSVKVWDLRLPRDIELQNTDHLQWVAEKDLHRLAIPKAFLKALNFI